MGKLGGLLFLLQPPQLIFGLQTFRHGRVTDHLAVTHHDHPFGR